MAFEKLTIRRSGNKVRGLVLPASISLSSRKSGASVKVSLMPRLTSEAGFELKARFNVLFGNGEDAGKLRIVADEAGSVVSGLVKRSGGLVFDLGLQPTIGTQPHKRVRADARLISAGVIEMDVPDFGSAQPTVAAPVKASAPPAAPMGGVRKAQTPTPGDTLNGITIDLTLDEENVTFKGKCVDVTTRQAKMVRLLAKPRPQTVGEPFLIGALWDGKPPASAGEQLRQMVADLQKGLSGIGLDLRLVKGAGYQLRDL